MKKQNTVKRIVSVALGIVLTLSAFCNILAATWTSYGYITYLGNGGTFSSGSSYTVSYSHTFSTGDNAYFGVNISSIKPSRTGYKFTGWWGTFSSNPLSDSSITFPSAKPNLYSGNTVYIMSGTANTSYVVACWERISYNITYNYNDGKTAAKTSSKYYGDNFNLGSAEREGYTFLGWSKTSGSTSVDYKPNAVYTANANLTVYAVWEPNTYVINYHDNGGTGSPESQTKTHDVALKIPSAVPQRSGYTFLGWSEEADSVSAEYQPGENLPEKDMELYAVWRIIIPTNSATVQGCAESEAQRKITEDIYFSAEDKLQYFSIVLSYPSFLSYESYESGKFEGEIMVAERTSGNNRVLELSYYNNDGFSVSGTEHLCRLTFDVNESSSHKYGTYSIAVSDSSYYVASGTPVALIYTGAQGFEYLPHKATGIDISGEDTISLPTAYTADFTPQNTTDKSVKWSVDDESVAAVDSSGVLTPLKNGSVTLTVHTLDGSDLYAYKDITVIGQRSPIDNLSVAEAETKLVFNKNTYEYLAYVPLDTTEITVTAEFHSGTLICEGYGYLFSGISKTLDISSDMQSYTFTHKDEDYDDTKYVLSVIRRNPPTPTPVAPTSTPKPASTPMPTTSPSPRATPKPTSNPLPTASPSATQKPTAAPTPTPTPTPTPEPIDDYVVSIDSVSVKTSTERYDIDVTMLNNIPQNDSFKLIAAAYDENRLVNISAKDIFSGDSSAQLSFYAEHADCVRLFAWKGFSDMRPLCNIMTVYEADFIQ